jgi:hypothetical protein
MSELVDNLKKLVQEYSKQLGELREKIRVLEEVPQAEALVGKCFKYLNHYNSSNQWWLYTKIVRAKDGIIWVDSFQEDSYGKIEIEFDKNSGIDTYNYMGNSSILISEEEYIAAQKALIKKIVTKSKRSS